MRKLEGTDEEGRHDQLDLIEYSPDHTVYRLERAQF